MKIPLKEIKSKINYIGSFYSGRIYDVPPLSVFDYLYEFNYSNPDSFIKTTGKETSPNISFKIRRNKKNFSFSFVMSFKDKITKYTLVTNYTYSEINNFLKTVLYSNNYDYNRHNDIYIADLSKYLDKYNLNKINVLKDAGYDIKLYTNRPKGVSIKFNNFDFFIYPKGKIIIHKNPKEKLTKVCKYLQKIIFELY